MVVAEKSPRPSAANPAGQPTAVRPRKSKPINWWALVGAAALAMRYFRNDKGETFAERGANQVRTGHKRKLALQFLALYGAINLFYLFCYNLPINILNMHNTSWSQGVQEISYMNDNLCGPGTGYACPTKDTPIPWNGSAHLTPEGTLAPAR